MQGYISIWQQHTKPLPDKQLIFPLAPSFILFPLFFLSIFYSSYSSPARYFHLLAFPLHLLTCSAILLALQSVSLDGEAHILSTLQVQRHPVKFFTGKDWHKVFKVHAIKYTSHTYSLSPSCMLILLHPLFSALTLLSLIHIYIFWPLLSFLSQTSSIFFFPFHSLRLPPSFLVSPLLSLS